MLSPLKDKDHQPLSWKEVFAKINLRLGAVWQEAITAKIYWLSFIPSHTFRRFILSLAGVKLQPGATIHSGIRLYDPTHISLGSDTIIGYNATLDGRAALTIGSHVDIASDVMIYNSEHDLNDPHFTATLAPVTIEDYCFVGPRAIIMPGVTVSKGAVVAAAAVVTKDVPAGIIVGGVPAKPIGERELSEYHYRLGRPRLFM